jgi:hypothetical protein
MKCIRSVVSELLRRDAYKLSHSFTKQTNLSIEARERASELLNTAVAEYRKVEEKVTPSDVCEDRE